MMLNRRRPRLKFSRPKRRSYSSLSRRRNSGGALFVMAGLLIVAAIVLTVISLIRFKSVAVVYPNGSEIGDIPVGGLSRRLAEERLRDAYSIPVELSYRGARVQFSPESLGLRLNVEDVLNQADEQNPGSTWWNYLWGRIETPKSFNIPMRLVRSKALIVNVGKYFPQSLVISFHCHSSHG